MTSILTLPRFLALCQDWVGGYYFVPIDRGRIEHARQSNGEAKIRIFNNSKYVIYSFSVIYRIFLLLDYHKQYGINKDPGFVSIRVMNGCMLFVYLWE